MVNFQEYRVNAGYAQQKDLAKVLGISISYMSRIEAGKRIPPTWLAIAIASKLGVLVEELFGNAAEPAQAEVSQ